MPGATTASTSCGASWPRRPRRLTEGGALVCEIGRGRDLVVRDYPDLPFVWLDTEESEGEVFLAARGRLCRSEAAAEAEGLRLLGGVAQAGAHVGAQVVDRG